MADEPILLPKPLLSAIPDAPDLQAIEALTGTGVAARTGTNTWALRTLTAPAAGITVSNGDGASGNPTLALANDLAAYEGLSSTGMVARTGDGTAATRTITAPAAGITVSNGDGVSGNPTLALANDLAALEGLSTTGVIVRTGDGTATTRTLTAGTGISITNGDGVSGNPTITATGGTGTVTSVGLSLPSIITVSGSPVTSSGTLTGTLATQTANTVFSGPTTGGAATPAFRALVAADIPDHSTDKLTSGTLPVGRGGTGITTTPSNGFIPIGNGTTYTAAAITAGTGITVTNGAGSITIAASTSVDNGICEGRLTPSTGVPVPTGDVTGATTLYYTPYKGNRIALYNGSAWSIYTFTERSLTFALSTGNVADVFIYDNSGTLTLEKQDWSSASARSVALAYQDGVLVKSTATTRRYLGTFYCGVTGGSAGVAQTESTKTMRHIWNYYNRVDRDMYVEDTSAAFSYATATWREFRGVTTQRLSFVVGVLEDSIPFSLWAGLRGTGINRVAMGFNSTTSPSNPSTGFIGDGGGTTLLQYVSNAVTGRISTDIALGYNYATCLQYTDTGTGSYEKMRLSGILKG